MGVIRAFQCFFFLLGLFLCSGTLVRISHDGRSLSSTADLLRIVKLSNSSHIRFSDQNSGVLRKLCVNKTNLGFNISMEYIVSASRYRAFAGAGVQKKVSSFAQCMKISSITVSSEPMAEDRFHLLLPALKAFDSAIKSKKLEGFIKLAASFSISFIEYCFKPSLKPPSLKCDILLQVMDFLRASNAYLTINESCKEDFSIEDCLVSAVNRVSTVFSSQNIHLQINLKAPLLSSLTNHVEVGEKLIGEIRKKDHVIDRFVALFIEKPSVTSTEQKEIEHITSLHSFRRVLTGNEVQQPTNNTPQLDVTSPLATVPVINPSTLVPTVISNEPASPVTIPFTTPSNIPMMTSPASSGQSWCIASQTASLSALQSALDYACGHEGVDCSGINQGGSCYDPVTLHDHASYAFNEYYQNNPIASSCNFGGAAVLTNADPSILTCRYASISTSSSVLNTTNLSGATVFGSVSPDPTTSAAALSWNFTIVCTLVCHLFYILTINHYKEFVQWHLTN